MIETVSLQKMTAKGKPVAITGVASVIASKKVKALGQEIKILDTLFCRVAYRVQSRLEFALLGVEVECGSLCQSAGQVTGKTWKEMQNMLS